QISKQFVRQRYEASKRQGDTYVRTAKDAEYLGILGYETGVSHPIIHVELAAVLTGGITLLEFQNPLTFVAIACDSVTTYVMPIVDFMRSYGGYMGQFANMQIVNPFDSNKTLPFYRHLVLSTD